MPVRYLYVVTPAIRSTFVTRSGYYSVVEVGRPQRYTGRCSPPMPPTAFNLPELQLIVRYPLRYGSTPFETAARYWYQLYTDVEATHDHYVPDMEVADDLRRLLLPLVLWAVTVRWRMPC